jgi:N-acylglucosamine 2-epimerase
MQINLAAHKKYYRQMLKDNIIPFWLTNCPDKEQGGYITNLDRYGKVYDTDKTCMWSTGRMIWVFSFLYNQFEKRTEYLAAAEQGIKFIKQHGFASDGRMYYGLTQAGEPITESQDVFVELFWILGLTEYAKATGNREYFDESIECFEKIWGIIESPETAPSVYGTGLRKVKMHAPYVISINVAQSCQEYSDSSFLQEVIEKCINVITVFLRGKNGLIHEAKYADGSCLPGEKGRWVCPGHMIEAGIFLIRQGKKTGDNELIKTGLDIIKLGFEYGWDFRYGGLYNDIDIEGHPPGSVSAYMRYPAKLWWQQAEALHGSLLACLTSNDKEFCKLYKQTFNYCDKVFVDKAGSEWFSYVSRKGEVINTAKGSERKSAFHVVRNYIWNLQLL